MLVFDPLAIALVVAANFAFSQTNTDEKKQDPESIEESNEEKENVENPIESSQIEDIKREVHYDEGLEGQSIESSIQEDPEMIQEEIVSSSEIPLEPESIQEGLPIQEDLTIATSTKEPENFSGYKAQDHGHLTFRDPTRIR